MSLAARTALGIDVGDGTLKAVLLSRRGRRVTLHRTWRVPCEDGADPDAAGCDAVAALLAAARPGAGTRLVIAAPARGLLCRTVTLPTMDRARLDELVRYELLSEAGVPAEDLLFRHAALREGGPEPRVVAIALRRREVDAFRSGLAARNLSVDALVLPGLALAAAVDEVAPCKGDRVLLAVGRLSTDLVLTGDDGIWMRRLPLGVASGTSVTLADRLHREIESATAYFVSRDRVFRPQDVVLTEEGALDAALTGALKQALGAPVTRIQSLGRIRPALRARHAGHSPEAAMAAGRALGLALTGLGLSAWQELSLPGDARRAAARLLPAAAASVLLSAATLGGAGLLAQARADTLHAEVVRLDQAASDLQSHASRQDDLLVRRAGLQERATLIASFAGRRAAAFAPHRALAALSVLQDERGHGLLHVESLRLAGGEPGRPGQLSLSVDAAPEFDADLGDRLARALRAEFEDVTVSGPAVPVDGVSRWTVEVRLP